jgi:tripartite-type tricarboxylate transporter receptor subunit TctC
MTIARRRVLALAAAFAAVSRIRLAKAAAWPSQPVRLVVPFPPGGSNDVVARHLGPALSEFWRQPVLIENRPGAGANIGIESVARAAPDGYTALITPVAIAVNRFLYSSVKYDPVTDFAPVSLICSEPNIVSVPATSPVTSIREFISRAKGRPGAMTYASAGYGTSLHLCGELFMREAGINLTHVPYKGSGPAITDLMAGRVDAMFTSTGSMSPYLKSGKVRALAVTSLERSPAFPELPTVAESAIPGFDVGSWFAMFAPARTPRDVVENINSAVRTVLHARPLQSAFTSLGARVVGSTPRELGQHLESEMRKWEVVIKAAHIKAEA